MNFLMNYSLAYCSLRIQCLNYEPPLKKNLDKTLDLEKKKRITSPIDQGYEYFRSEHD